MSEINHVVSFSGGRTSAYLVFLMEIARKMFGWNVFYVYCDTGVEHGLTYRFIREIVKFWGIDLIVLRTVINPILGEGNSFEVFGPEDLSTHRMPPFEPFKSMMKKYGTPYSGGEFCSERMKKDPFEAYCNQRFGKGNYITWLGMRSDEPKRLKPKTNVRYLADLVEIDKPSILSWWKKQVFDLLIDEDEGNCLFCMKKSTPKLALALKKNPGLARVWFKHIDDKDVRIVETRKTPSNVMYRGYLSLEGIATMYESSTIEELADRVRFTKSLDTGSCSESCEAIAVGSGPCENNIPASVLANFDVALQKIKESPEMAQMSFAL
ncbi:phosphoadenosine phosphosulfate reductase family protein [Moritella sp. F3]|uniref:phosphoadenosine phosphosulfate reductase domain-containing protein n=1 Tax=Moritella sp. F3 TaxID=2718882 RepID=UPI001A1ABC1B|nr:phosphoadenosine phosphosulfate reductase family protein [Moritella sp. F3]GIC77682.1 hypothetical protein FMO001_24090 [Moritella sp. F1]GIC82095.1 hypothetical protein FMO003_23760 [Moritella sp. F3]